MSGAALITEPKSMLSLIAAAWGNLAAAECPISDLALFYPENPIHVSGLWSEHEAEIPTNSRAARPLARRDAAGVRLLTARLDQPLSVNRRGSRRLIVLLLRNLTRPIAQAGACRPLHHIEQHCGDRDDQRDGGHDGA